jgi:dihydrofolate reductase
MMRKIIFQMMVSLDGYYEGPNGELDWHVVDDEFNAYAHQLLDSLDGLIFGRKTYELMANFWPSESALRDDPVTARYMNSLHKYVVSQTVKKVDWENSSLLKGDPAVEIARLKAQPGKDLAIFGSSDLVVSLDQPRLIDEYRFFFAPVVLGNGKPLLAGLKHQIKMKLIESLVFKTGVVVNRYTAQE